MKLIIMSLLASLSTSVFAHEGGHAAHKLVESHHGSPVLWIMLALAALSLLVFKASK